MNELQKERKRSLMPALGRVNQFIKDAKKIKQNQNLGENVTD